MIPRLLKPSQTNSFFLFGARGTGKSTFVRDQLSLENALWLDLLDPEQEELYLKNPKYLEHQIETSSPDWVVIDEVQRSPKLLNMAHRLIESRQQKFVLLGSSARKLKRGLGNMLAGRAFLHTLFPLTALELGEGFELEQVLQWGSLPKVFSYPDELERRRYLRSYVQSYVREEIQQEQLLRRLEPFRLFLDIAAQMSGKIINASGIAKEAGCDGKTIMNYFQILEETYIGFFLPHYHQSIRKSQKHKPKFYFFDLGVKRALDQTLGHLVAPSTSLYGDLFEHFVVQEIYRLNSYYETDFRLSYFQVHQGSEVDLVLTKAGVTTLIEIKSARSIDEKRVNALARVAESFGDKVRSLYLSQAPEALKVSGVECYHWLDGIRNLFPSQIPGG